MKIVFAHGICIRELLCHNHTKTDNRFHIQLRYLMGHYKRNFDLSLAAKLRKLYLLALFKEKWSIQSRQLLALFG